MLSELIDVEVHRSVSGGSLKPCHSAVIVKIYSANTEAYSPQNWNIVKGKGLDTCCSATYMSQTRDQQRFAISEVAADWHEPMVPQRITWPSIAHTNGQLDPRCS